MAVLLQRHFRQQCALTGDLICSHAAVSDALDPPYTMEVCCHPFETPPLAICISQAWAEPSASTQAVVPLWHLSRMALLCWVHAAHMHISHPVALNPMTHNWTSLHWGQVGTKNFHSLQKPSTKWNATKLLKPVLRAPRNMFCGYTFQRP